MELTLVAGPSYFPVSLAEAKEHMNIDTSNTDHDGRIKGLINTVTDRAERFLGRKLVYQTWKMFLNDFPGTDYITLPFGQLKSVTHLKYYDTDGDATTWTSSNYIVSTDSEPGKLVLTYANTWPTDTLYPVNGVEIQFVCGYYMGDEWAVSTAKSEDDYIVPTTYNNLCYQAGGNGTTHSSEPTWTTTIGGTTTDNDITWTCAGEAVPEQIKDAIKMGISDIFEQREDHLYGISHVDLKIFESLLWPYKVWL